MSSGNRKQLLLTHGLNISLNWLACDMLIRHYRCITDDGSQTKFIQTNVHQHHIQRAKTNCGHKSNINRITEYRPFNIQPVKLTQIKKRLCSVSSQLSELFIWEEQCQHKSTLLLAQRPFTEPLIHLFSLDFLLFKFEQSIMCGAKYRAAIFMSSVDMLLMSHPTSPNPVS